MNVRDHKSGVHISGLAMAMEKANLMSLIFIDIYGLASAMENADKRTDIWRTYFWCYDGNENCGFKATYLASIFLASRRQ